jgi:hypothetical protein
MGNDERRKPKVQDAARRSNPSPPGEGLGEGEPRRPPSVPPPAGVGGGGPLDGTQFKLSLIRGAYDSVIRSEAEEPT